MSESRTNSLGLPGRPGDHRVVVAMSGGVDSSVTAALLKEEGFDVLGVTLQLYDHGAAVKKKGACCAGTDIRDASHVAGALGIPHYVLDYEAKFRKAVIEDFADSYKRGETPIPCVRCNERVKFADLLDTARELGADALATGHYVRRVEGPNGPELHRGTDPARDQSYFLYRTTRAQLDFVRFPLGAMPKAEVRAIAERLGLTVADKADSQDICFVPQGKYADVVQRVRPGVGERGEIVHIDGSVLGSHEGIINYTVGQRRGLGLAVGEPLFVVRIEAAARRVVVGPREALMTRRVAMRDVNWLDGETLEAGREVLVKVRSTRPPKPARLFLDGANATVELYDAEEAVAPGQACVIYDAEDGGSRVLGGGWIVRHEAALAA